MFDNKKPDLILLLKVMDTVNDQLEALVIQPICITRCFVFWSSIHNTTKYNSPFSAS